MNSWTRRSRYRRCSSTIQFGVDQCAKEGGVERWSVRIVDRTRFKTRSEIAHESDNEGLVDEASERR